MRNTSRTAQAIEAILVIGLAAAAGLMPMQRASSNSSQDTLVRAAARGDLKSVQDLLDHDAAVNVTSSWGETALRAASSSGLAAVVQLLLSRGADVNARDKLLGETALMSAAISGQLEVVKLLIAHGADINAQGGNPLTFNSPALSTAASGGHTAVVEALLDAGANPNFHENTAWATTALAVAARGGHVASMRALIAHGADVNATSNTGVGPFWTTGVTVLMDAAAPGNLEAVKLSLAHGAAVNAHDSKGQSALSKAEAAHPRNPAIIQPLKQTGAQGASLSPQDALVDAAKRGDITAVEALLDRGVSIDTLNSSGTNALMEAAESGRTAVVQLLLSRGANWEARDQFMGSTALAHAAVGGSAAVAKILLEHGAKVDERTRAGMIPDVTPLMLAAPSGNVEVAKLLIAHGADVNAQDQHGLTPLMMCASEQGSAAMVRLLLAHGAKVNARTRDTSMTALLMAAEFAPRTEASPVAPADIDYAAVAGALLEGGADPNARNSSSWTPLHQAAWHRQLGMVRSLIAHGADVNARTPKGWTVLMAAASGGSPAVVKLLLDHGADVNAQDHENRRTFTALLVARQHEGDARKSPPRSRSYANASDYAAIVRLLVEAGAKA